MLFQEKYLWLNPSRLYKTCGHLVFRQFLLTSVLLASAGAAHAQSIGIGTISPDSSAKFEVSSTTKGFLPPRITAAQRDSIQNPAEGLVIYCTDCFEMQVFNGYLWKNMAGYAASGKSYPSVRICNDVWMLKNLAVRTYRNGDSIPVVTDPVAWSQLTTGAMCWFLNNPNAYDSTFGPLYNWYALNDPRGVVPEGWHLSTKTEWLRAAECLGGDSIAALKMRDTSQLWNYSLPFPVFANNASGFTGLPGGFRQGNDGFYTSLGTDGGFWWTATEDGQTKAWYFYLVYDGAMMLWGSNLKTFAFSVRCVKD